MTGPLTIAGQLGPSEGWATNAGQKPGVYLKRQAALSKRCASILTGMALCKEPEMAATKKPAAKPAKTAKKPAKKK